MLKFSFICFNYYYVSNFIWNYKLILNLWLSSGSRTKNTDIDRVHKLGIIIINIPILILILFNYLVILYITNNYIFTLNHLNKNIYDF